ncbi:hypothetical protein ACJX0J_011692, partial [Zea mays]
NYQNQNNNNKDSLGHFPTGLQSKNMRNNQLIPRVKEQLDDNSIIIHIEHVENIVYINFTQEFIIILILEEADYNTSL